MGSGHFECCDVLLQVGRYPLLGGAARMRPNKGGGNIIEKAMQEEERGFASESGSLENEEMRRSGNGVHAGKNELQ